MKNILKPNPLILANTFSVKKSLLQSRILMLQKARSLRLALLKFTFFIPVLLLCILTALSFKEEIHLENTLLAETKKNLDSFISFPSIETEKEIGYKEKFLETEDEKKTEIIKQNITDSAEYIIETKLINENVPQEDKYFNMFSYEKCVSKVELKLFKKGKKDKLSPQSWKNLNPEFSVHNGKLIKTDKINELIIVPYSQRDFKINIKEKSLNINYTTIINLFPLPQPKVSLSNLFDFEMIGYNVMEHLPKNEIPKKLYVTLEAPKSFKYAYPREAVFIPKKVIVMQYRGENEDEIATKNFKNGKIDLTQFDLEGNDMLEIRLMTYEHVNSLGERSTIQLKRRGPKGFAFFLNVQ